MPTNIQDKYVRQIKQNEKVCRCCGESDSDLLSVDHIQPVAFGGSSTDLDNMQLLCIACNRIKDTYTWEFPIVAHKADMMTASEFIEYKHVERRMFKMDIDRMKKEVIQSIKRTVNLADRAAIKSAIAKTKKRIKISDITG